jgi:Tol biopolymer transport system component
MASNGTAKSFLFARDASEIDEPSHLDYGGYRWWLTTVDDMVFGADIYAFRADSTGELISVQLTDVARDGINLMGNLARVRWSNGDAFITAVGVDNRTSPPSFNIWSINISGLEIDENPLGVSPVTVSDVRFSSLVTAAEEIQGGYALSPDGSKVVYATTSGVWVEALTTHDKLFLRADGSRFDWSPDSTRISFTIDPSVWIMNADGSGAKIVAQGKVSGLFPNQYSPRYLHSFWSPDGNWLSFRRDQIVRIRGSQYATQSDIVEMTATGGTIINLTSDMNAFSWKLAFAWRRPAFAYPNP